MYYLTFFNYANGKYTLELANRPHLRFRERTLNRNLLSLDNLPELEETDKIYSIFRIPKASGGFRTISAPSEPLKLRQRRIVDYMQIHAKVLEDVWAYAYVKETSFLDALKQHTNNHSRWFLKLDIKDFFPSCKKDIVLNELANIYPICAWSEEDRNYFLEQITKYCFLDNSLPQGAVSSPLLSNLTLTSYDYKIHKALQKAETFTKQKYVYTRYADDILISAKNSFEWQEVASVIQNIFGNKFILKHNKTRYGNSAGRNWNLGCMINKDNNITIGYRQKEHWKRIMMDIIIRHNSHETITLEEKRELMGKLAYYKMIEPDYFNYLNSHYIQKYNTDFEAILKQHN